MVLTTREKLRQHKKFQGDLPRKIWRNLDGTRSSQFSTCVKFSTFSPRVFESWITWEARILDDGRKEYVVAFVPMDEYAGEYHNTREIYKQQLKKCVRGTTRAIYVVTELAKNTCVWTRLQSVDVKAGLPKTLVEMMIKSHLAWANEVQAKYRRNGKVIDTENIDAFTKMITSWRGRFLTPEQSEINERCKNFFEGKNKENVVNNSISWKPIQSPYHDVEMFIKLQNHSALFIDSTEASGRARGVIDATAAQVAAWIFDFNSRATQENSRENHQDVARGEQ